MSTKKYDLWDELLGVTQTGGDDPQPPAPTSTPAEEDDVLASLAEILGEDAAQPVQHSTGTEEDDAQPVQHSTGTEEDDPEVEIPHQPTPPTTVRGTGTSLDDILGLPTPKPAPKAARTPASAPAPRQAKAKAITLPTFTTKEALDAIDLRHFATLVTLSTARWQARKKDKKASEDVAAANNADADAFHTTKKLLAGADGLLKDVNSKLDAARGEHYRMTMPWTMTGANDVGRQRGPRTLPNTRLLDYIAVMKTHKDEVTVALNKFVAEYPQLIQRAAVKLGTRFDPNDYPTVAEIRDQFGMDWEFSPMPHESGFCGLPQQQAEKLARDMAKRQHIMVENALQDAWLRTYEAVSHLHERLEAFDREPTTASGRRETFRDTTVYNVHTAMELLSHSNMLNDIDLQDIIDYAQVHIVPFDPKTLREDDTVRNDVRRNAATLLSMMDRFARRNPNVTK